MWYAAAAIVALIVGYAIWSRMRAYDAGRAKQMAEDYQAAQGQRREGDAVQVESVADEDDWLDRQRDLHQRMQDDADD